MTGYFMGYYTIWLALVKRILVPFWELQKWEEVRTVVALISVRKRIVCPPSCPRS
jgi:hypothetical protein